MKTLPLDQLPGSLKICNCAGCGKLLTGKGHKFPKLETVFSRINKRPYCYVCVLRGVKLKR